MSRPVSRPPQQTTSEFAELLLEWAATEGREFPWRNVDRSFYEVFVAEFFLTQTPAENVAAVYEDFLEDYPDLDHLAEATESELRDVIEPLGFQNRRAAALTEIAAEYDHLPRNVADLEELPRVGPYVAAATVCFATGESRAIRDRNVDRVYRRVLGEEWTEWNERARDAFAQRQLEGVDPRQYQFALLDLGGTVCTESGPTCGECPLSGCCASSRS